jgi:hypothetical protein
VTLSRLISVTAPRLSGRERTKGVLERLSLTVQGPVAAMQRLESVAPSEPAHADRTKQSLGRANELWSEWRLYEVLRPYDLHEAGRHPRAAASLLLQLAVPTEAGIPTFPLAALNRSSPAAAWDRSGLGFSAVSDRWQLRRRRGACSRCWFSPGAARSGCCRPAAWPAGELRGVRARCGVKVDLTWAGGRVTRAMFRGRPGRRR